MLKIQRFIGDKEITEMANALGRSCGECSLCCYLLEVEELKLPARCACPYMANGCLIYVDRPNVCRDFACRWLIDGSISDDLKPSKSGLVIYFGAGENLINSGVPPTFNIHVRDKDGWRKEPHYSQIKQWAIEGLKYNLEGEIRQPLEQVYYLTVVHDHDEDYLILPNEDIDITKSYYMTFYNPELDDWAITKFPDKESAHEFAKEYNK